MSGQTLTRDPMGLSKDDAGETTYVSVAIRSNNPSEVLSQEFFSGLRNGLAQAGFRQPEEAVAEDRPPATDTWRIVAPGVLVRSSEYERRYGQLDLAYYQAQMSPAAFAAYVRFIGLIEGPPNVDVNQLMENVEL